MGNQARDVFFACRAQDYTFCLLTVRYMHKIKGESALKAQTFLHDIRDKVHECNWYRLSMHLSTENNADFLQCVQIKHFIGKIFIHQN